MIFSTESSALTIINNDCSSLYLTYENSNSEEPLLGSEINFRDFSKANSTKETLILIHGLNSNLSAWEGVIDQFTSNYRVVIFDQRGHGSTLERGSRYTNATMAGDLKGLMDHLNIKNATIVGHSMGGRTAIKFAALYPNLVRHLIVSDMHVRGEPVDFEAGLLRADALRALPATFANQNDAVVALNQIYGKGNENWSQVVASKMSRNEEGRWSFDIRPAAGELYETFALYEDLSPSLIRVQAPTLFIRAEDGTGGTAVLRSKDVNQILSLRPHTQIIKIDGADHSIHKSHPKQFARIVTEFINAKN